MKKILKWVMGCIGLVIVVLALMIVFGSSAPPPPMHSIIDVLAAIDRSDQPPVSHFPARDGAQLAYRAYPASPDRIAILIHGSSGSSASMHAAAKALSKAGITAYALDIRGHGESGVKGDIRYIGQLEDDLADFVTHVRVTYPNAPIQLIGHSSGGGFVMRVAGSPINHLFSRYIVTAPYLRYNAPTSRGINGGGWVKPFIPRFIAIGILNGIGIDWFSGLPVIAFALPADAKGTKTYSYRLWTNFAPHSDYLADIRRSNATILVLVGTNDEVVIADKYEQALAPVKQYVRLEVIPGMGHVAMVSDPVALAALVRACTD
jgi:alpha-beta hydrolase superfamily lysophospholipase